MRLVPLRLSRRLSRRLSPRLSRRLATLAAAPLALLLLLATPARADEPPAGAHAAAHGAEHGVDHPLTNPIENFFNFSYSGKTGASGHALPPPFLLALLNFAVLAFLLGKFVAPSVVRMVRDRHDTVSKQLAESARLRAEAEAKLAEYTRLVAGLEGELTRLTDGIRAEAADEKRRAIAEAEARAKRIAADAEQQIAAELVRVRTELERELVLAAIAAAEAQLKKSTTDGDQRGLAETFVKQLAQSPRGTSPNQRSTP